jgi:hypothetical protein
VEKEKDDAKVKVKGEMMKRSVGPTVVGGYG